MRSRVALWANLVDRSQRGSALDVGQVNAEHGQTRVARQPPWGLIAAGRVEGPRIVAAGLERHGEPSAPITAVSRLGGRAVSDE